MARGTCLAGSENSYRSRDKTVSELLSKTGLPLCRAAFELRGVGNMHTISTLSHLVAGGPRPDGARFDRMLMTALLLSFALNFFPTQDNKLGLPAISQYIGL